MHSISIKLYVSGIDNHCTINLSKMNAIETFTTQLRGFSLMAAYRQVLSLVAAYRQVLSLVAVIDLRETKR